MALSELIQGFQDATLDAEPQLKKEEMTSLMQLLNQQIQEQQKKFLHHLAEENRKEGEAFLTANKQKEGVNTLPSGLQYKILKSGNGPHPTFFDTVTVHYRGTFIDGNEFDSSYTRGQPQTFPLNRVIAGWTEALQKMKVGDRWQLFVPHYLAYGEAGFSNMIPPNATLVFEMELLSIN
jgi:FKBP-type peptidyl-prolyl cis-trans isomerase FklB